MKPDPWYVSLGRAAMLCAVLGAGVVFVLRELQEIHRSVDRIGRTALTQQDFAMRTFHYVKPHDPYGPLHLENGMVLTCCAECADILRRNGDLEEPGTFIPVERYEALLEIERKWNQGKESPHGTEN